jgi:UDP-2,3-diacylglucosamine pyrophosphatase LpxH
MSRTELLPDRIIVVSDLHLGEGVAPVRGRISGEHFFHDRAFATWLSRLTRRGSRRGQRLELVVNGDAFDFLRVTRIPEGRRAVAAWRLLLRAARVQGRGVRDRLRQAAVGRFTFRERTFGFGSDEACSVWKLAVIAAAHWSVFQALAAWCRAGQALVIVRGNHDPEWAWPGVRRALMVLLERAGEGKGEGTFAFRRIRFRSRVHRRANVHVEHGHDVQWLTRTEHDFSAGQPERLRLSFGSLISRYVLNVLERRVPPRPVPPPPSPALPPSGRLVQALHEDPWSLVPAIVSNALRAIPFIGLSGWRPWFGRLLQWWPARVSMTMSTALLVALPLTPIIGDASLGRSRAGVMLASLLGLCLPIAGFMSRQIADEIDRDGLEAEVRRYARRVATAWEGGELRPPPAAPRYVVFGHTHRADAREWSGAEGGIVYLNPGAWAPRPEERGAPASPRFIWLARRGGYYARHRLLSLDAVTH